MNNISVKLYQSHFKKDWNAFLALSNQDTILFYSDFMDYHSDRFEDMSLLIYLDKVLIALFPAHITDNVAYSHSGLTYGGLIHKFETDTKLIIACYKALLEYFFQQNISTLIIKSIPEIYLHNPTHNILSYVVFKTQAKLITTDLHSVIDMRFKTYSKSRINGIKRAKKHQLNIEETSNFESFWNNILIPNLAQKHTVAPVHSLEDITYLKSKFPNNIRQFNVYHNHALVAGTTIFEMKTLAHSQYISANTTKNTLGSLDYLHQYLLETIFSEKRYFSFGISNTNRSENINEGLLYWKEGFGARPIPQSVYSINTENFKTLETIFI